MLDSHFHYDASHYPPPLNQVPVTSFFGSVSSVRSTPSLSSTGEVAALLEDGQLLQAATASEAGEAGAPARACSNGAGVQHNTSAGAAVQHASEAGLPAISDQAAVAVGASVHPGGIPGPAIYIGMMALASLLTAASLIQYRWGL